MTTPRAYLPALPPLMIHHDRVFRHGKIGDNNHVLAVIGADVIHLCVADLLLSSDTNGFNSKLTKGYLSVCHPSLDELGRFATAISSDASFILCCSGDSLGFRKITHPRSNIRPLRVTLAINMHAGQQSRCDSCKP